MAEEKMSLEEIIGKGGTLGLDSSEDPVDYPGFNDQESLGMESWEKDPSEKDS